ncbi:MAG: histidine kinase [bacterium]|nr:histidine kinase [bacterium]
MDYVPMWAEEWVDEGIKKGMKKGEMALIRNAKLMLKDGLPLETIQKYTGLSANKIKKLSETSH